MTVEVAMGEPIIATGNDTATTFSFSPLVIYATSDLEVTHVDASNVETLLTEGTGSSNYSVGVSTFPNTGSITYPADEVTPLPTGEFLYIKLKPPQTQTTDFRNQGGYDPADLENAVDKLQQQIQELNERLGRVPILPISSTNITNFETDRPAALEGLRVNTAGTGLEWASLTVSTTDATASDAVPQPVSLTAGAAGSGDDFSRDDHEHLLPTVTVAKGGTGATTAAGARTNLGAIGNIVEDTTPQLGGPLDTNSQQINWSKGADVASAAALTLGTDGNYFDITGTTTITSIATLAVGTVVKLHFDGALTLTHHATDLILPGGANITTAAGDEAEFVEYATGDWRCTNYSTASGAAIVVSNGNLGSANTGVTATEVGNGYHHVTTLAVSVTDALTLADNAALAVGYLLYTLPAGVVVIHSAYMTMGITAASAQQQSDTPDVGLGTTVGSGAVAVLGGTVGFENVLDGTTAADANGTATVNTDGSVSLVVESGDAHTIYFNVADTWADDLGGDLTADISGTVVIEWTFLA